MKILKDRVTIAASTALLVALVALNGAAFVRGQEEAWLLGGALLANMLAIGVAVFVTAREVLVADQRTTASTARLESIVDSAMDAIIIVDEAQNIVLFNRAAEQVFKIGREHVLHGPLDRFIPQAYRAGHRDHIEKFGRTGVIVRRTGDATTLWGLRADGEEFPLEASISQTAEGGRRHFTVILRDITVRKQEEDALKRSERELRELSARMLETREEEKTRIARELHDELGQLLTALRMHLASLREAPADARDEKMQEMDRLLDQTVSATRRIAADLRPVMLDDLGLVDAAQWLVEEFAKHSGITCHIERSGSDALEGLSKSLSTTVYRTIQESLTNIGRHAGAKSAWVALAAQNGWIDLTVEDDGRGIAPEDFAKAQSFGLKGVRERISYFGGSLEIARVAGGGTRLRARLPLRCRIQGEPA